MLQQVFSEPGQTSEAIEQDQPGSDFEYVKFISL